MSAPFIGPLRASLSVEAPKLIRPFSISTGTRTHQPFLNLTLSDGQNSGRGASPGLRYFGETPETLRQQIEAIWDQVESGLSRDHLREWLPAGGARAALDAALWELEAARAGTSVAAVLGLEPHPLASAFTIGLDTPEVMAVQAQKESWRPLLKVKLGGSTDKEPARLKAVAEAASNTRLVIDANGGWPKERLVAWAQLAASLGYELLEQPLAAGQETNPEAYRALHEAARHLPLCADESFQTEKDFDCVAEHYQAVNIKLDKCGGLTSALDLMVEARKRNLLVFVGCMLAPTLSIAPAFLLAQSADYVDLDGPFWFFEEPVTLNSKGFFDPIAPHIWGQGKAL